MFCEFCPNKDGPCIRPNAPTKKGGLAIVAESPGHQEVRKGQLFVGPAGQVLRKTLTSVGLRSFDDVYLTSALLCLPEGGGKTPRKAVESCAVRLREELRQAEPDIILALGNTSLHAVTGDFNLKITREQGRVFKTEYGIMIPAIHPAMVLRSPGTYKGFRNALSYVIKLANGHKPKNPGESKYSVIDSAEKGVRVVQSFMRMKDHVFAVDIETTGFNRHKDKIICLGIAWAKNKTVIFPREYINLLINLFEQTDKTFVWHNGKFDSEFLHHAGIEARVDQDTMLMHYTLNEIKGTHDLEQLATSELGAAPYEHKLKPYLGKGKNYSHIPRKVLYEYLAKDCDYTRQLYFVFKDKIDSLNDTKNVYNKILMPASRFLQKVERYGIQVDKTQIRLLRSDLEARSEELRQKIAKGVKPVWDPVAYALDMKVKKIPEEFNPGSPKQLAWLLYKKIGLKPPRGMQANTREDTLMALKPRIKLIDLILELRSVEKQLKTYVIGISNQVQDDGRVHCTYLLHGTVTGRLASREPNMQNIPRDKKIKDIFRASPGHIFIEADYKGAELRVLAYLSDDRGLIQIFKDGRDLHSEVAVAMYGEGFTEDQRVRAKAINFGIPYGRGARDIAREFNISVREASDMIMAWFRRFPQAHDYIREVRDAVAAGKVLRSPLGRLRRFGLVSRETIHGQENEASNFAIQSTASDLTLISAMRMQPLLEKIGGHIVNLVHDSILVEVQDTDNRVLAASKIVTATMVSTPELLLNSKVPFEVELKKGYSWGSLSKFELKSLTETLKTALISQ